MKKMFGYGKDKEFESFPYDWIRPNEIAYIATIARYKESRPLGEVSETGAAASWLDYAGFIPDFILYQMKLFARARIDAGLEPVFWMKPDFKDADDEIGFLIKQQAKDVLILTKENEIQEQIIGFELLELIYEK